MNPIVWFLYVTGKIIIKACFIFLLWKWIIPSAFPGLVEVGMIASAISYKVAFGIAILFTNIETNLIEKQ